jgi:hypothetical protein
MRIPYFFNLATTGTAGVLAAALLSAVVTAATPAVAGQLAWRTAEGGVVRVVPVASGTGSGYAVERLAPGGARDAAFGRDGRVPVQLGPDQLRPASITMDARGRILVVGNTDTPSGEGWALLRLQPNGQPDASLAGSGRSVNMMGASEAGVFDVVALDSGALLLAGSVKTVGGEMAVLSRWRADGGLDTHYGQQGWMMLHDIAANARAVALYRQPSGAIVLGVLIESDERTELMQMTLDANGVPASVQRPRDRRQINADLELGDVSLASAGSGGDVYWQFNPKQDASLPRFLDVNSARATTAGVSPLATDQSTHAGSKPQEAGAAAAQPFAIERPVAGQAPSTPSSSWLVDDETLSWLGVFLAILLTAAALFWWVVRSRKP